MGSEMCIRDRVNLSWPYCRSLLESNQVIPLPFERVDQRDQKPDEIKASFVSTHSSSPLDSAVLSSSTSSPCCAATRFTVVVSGSTLDGTCPMSR